MKCAMFLNRTAQYLMFTIWVWSINSNCIPVGNIFDCPRKVWSHLEMSFVNYPCQCFPGNLSCYSKAPIVIASLGSHQTHGQLCIIDWKSWEGSLLFVENWEVSWLSFRTCQLLSTREGVFMNWVGINLMLCGWGISY